MDNNIKQILNGTKSIEIMKIKENTHQHIKKSFALINVRHFFLIFFVSVLIGLIFTGQNSFLYKRLLGSMVTFLLSFPIKVTLSICSVSILVGMILAGQNPSLFVIYMPLFGGNGIFITLFSL